MDRTDRTPALTVRPARGRRSVDLRELWTYRELIYIFAWRDLKVRYRQTFLGVLWVMGQPLVTMTIFTLVFTRVAKIRADLPVPYHVFVLGSLLVWSFFANSVARAGNSLVGAAFLISKVYFPRLVIPISGVLVDLIDLGVSAVLLMLFMVFHGIAVDPSILFLPLVLVLAIVMTLGVGLWLAALNVEYRDIRILIPFLLQIGMYTTPVVYPLSVLPPTLRTLVQMNPLTGIVEAFRACIFGTPVPWISLAWSIVAAGLVITGGVYYFRRMERLFADVI